MMKNFLILSVLLVLLISISCTSSGESTNYIFTVDNQSSDTVQVCVRGALLEPFFDSRIICYELLPLINSIIRSYLGKGELLDYWVDTDVAVIEELQIYKDNVLVDKDFLIRDLWVFTNNLSYQAEYRLMLTDENLN
jgi:hypothetical protein